VPPHGAICVAASLFALPLPPCEGAVMRDRRRFVRVLQPGDACSPAHGQRPCGRCLAPVCEEPGATQVCWRT